MARVFRGRTLEAAYTGRDNALNFMRLCFALLVMVGHAGVIGWGPAANPVRLPIDAGGVAVTGFFGLSGFLISRSGRRSGALRFVWHRVLRIFPGYWVCLVVTAFGLAPLLFWYEHGTTGGFLHSGPGPAGYVYHNFLTDQLQSDVSRVTGDAPFGNALNGSLWTLKSELSCYLLVLVLAATTLLRRARWVVLLPGAGLLSVIVWDTFHEPVVPGPIAAVTPFHVPVLGWYLRYYVVAFGLAFVLGMAADVYRSVIPLNDVLGAASLALTAVSLWLGWPLFGPFIVAYVYLLLWAGARLPGPLRRIGRRNDYSYGVYIYAFPIQQALAILGVPRFGWTVYLLTSVAAVAVVAGCSWHLVERPAMTARNWTPRRFRRPPEAAATAPAPAPDVPAPRAPAPGDLEPV
ncbi:acyltransferase family protein [Dactylosporangium sp. CA-092794]|uniref:acyltransferase family protein n=1 Tax=Dactylosporangium sp. CA-092794 TaxID=3239929 RepID=UPI003D90F6B8